MQASAQMDEDRWPDARLDALRKMGDPEAAACIEELGADAQSPAVKDAMASLIRNDVELPAGLPAPFVAFVEKARTGGTPPDADLARLDRGALIYAAHATTGAICLLLDAIPQGYCSPCLAQPLHATGLLNKRPYHRLLAVLQMVVDVVAPHGFAPRGNAIMTGVRLRLMHEGVRSIIRRRLPDYEARFGVPVNVEDKLATLMGFSTLVIDSLQRLGSGLDDEDAEEVWFLWRAFGRAHGIPEDALPIDLADARAFFRRYAARHFATAPADNPEGVKLAHENLEMVRELIPEILQRLGFARLPEAFMIELMGVERAATLDVTPLPDSATIREKATHGIAHLLSTYGYGSSLALWLHATFARILFNRLIEKEYGGRPSIIIPAHVADLWKI
jgi:hypothetical protein